jgi:hypothetical protein
MDIVSNNIDHADQNQIPEEPAGFPNIYSPHDNISPTDHAAALNGNNISMHQLHPNHSPDQNGQGN